MTQEEKARAFDEIMEDTYSLKDKPQRLFLTLVRYVGLHPALTHAYHNAHKLLVSP